VRKLKVAIWLITTACASVLRELTCESLVRRMGGDSPPLVAVLRRNWHQNCARRHWDSIRQILNDTFETDPLYLAYDIAPSFVIIAVVRVTEEVDFASKE